MRVFGLVWEVANASCAVPAVSSLEICDCWMFATILKWSSASHWVALVFPVAIRAVRTRHRIRLDRRRGRKAFQPLHGMADIRCELVDGEMGVVVVAEHQVRLFRRRSLLACQESGIHAKLNEMLGLRMPSEFGVGRFVGVCTER